MNNPPRAYWEKRCSINEQVLSKLIDAVGGVLPHTQAPLGDLCDSWQRALDQLDAETKAALEALSDEN